MIQNVKALFLKVFGNVKKIINIKILNNIIFFKMNLARNRKFNNKYDNMRQ